MNKREKQIAMISIAYLKQCLGESISPIDLDHCNIHQLNNMVDALLDANHVTSK